MCEYWPQSMMAAGERFCRCAPMYFLFETVEAMHPFYVIRALGGVLFLLGSLIMVYNLVRTARHETRAEKIPVLRTRVPARPSTAGQPAE